MTANHRQHVSAIAHGDSPVWGPIGEATLEELVELLASVGVGTGTRIVDLGCGPAELLRRVCEKTRASGQGVDSSAYAIEEARRRASASEARDRIELRVADVADLQPEGSFDVTMCLGPGWEAGGWPAFARWAAEFTRPGGHLLIGDLAWRGEPDPEALAWLDMTRDEYPLSHEVERIVRESSIEVMWTHRATDAEWQAYATSYRSALRRFASEEPDHPITPAIVERAEAGWARYEQLHALLDFVIVLGGSARGSRRIPPVTTTAGGIRFGG